MNHHENAQHPLQAIGVHGTYGRELQQAQADGAPHKYRRVSAADDQVGEQIRDRYECPPDAEQLQNVGAGEPFLSNGNDDEFFGNQAQPEHGRERDESGKAQQFPEYGQLAGLVIGYTCKDGLGNAVYHTRNHRMPHPVPFVGLGEVAYFLFGVELSQQYGKQIVVDDRKDIGDNDLTAESYHLLYRAEIKAETGTPAGKVKIENGDHRHK